jgi:hypothetical protein
MNDLIEVCSCQAVAKYKFIQRLDLENSVFSDDNCENPVIQYVASDMYISLNELKLNNGGILNSEVLCKRIASLLLM